MSKNKNGVSTYQRNRAIQYQEKYGISYTQALRIVRDEMAEPDFNPDQPIREVKQ